MGKEISERINSTIKVYHSLNSALINKEDKQGNKNGGVQDYY